MITNSVVQLFDVAVVSLVSHTEFEFRFVSLVSGLMFFMEILPDCSFDDSCISGKLNM